MSLSAGTRLGPYEILSSIGAGGMGEVYKARDTRLDRTVAVKILPAHLSSNLQSRERFDREAKAISSLSHPHICPLYDVGHQDGIDFLVMEYLEGETLAQHLKKGPLPPDQALHYAVQITDALDTAHRHGVIHRDLKPGNIMITKTGAKLLDFGLAKVQASEAAAGMTQLPTQTAPLTAEGTILGTMQYMAPEQLEGQEADSRTDIFALGAVIYEMATGRRAFEGKSRASLIAAILEREPPPVSTLQPLTAPALDHVVHTCMAKDPDRRWQTAHDVLVELNWISESSSQTSGAPRIVSKARSRERILWTLAVTLLSIALANLGFVHFIRHSVEPHTVRFQLPLPDKVRLDSFDLPVVSPDGQRVVFPGNGADGTHHLWLRSLDSLTDQLLPDTDDAYFPFWSPDSRSIAFFTLNKLQRIDVAGGPAQTICDVAFINLGGTWSRNGTILLSGTDGAGIFRVSASGGEPKPVIQPERSRQETQQAYPQFLPDGKHFLFHSAGAKPGVYIGSLGNSTAQILLPDALAAAYAAPGFIIYPSQGSLLARGFDAAKLQFTGDAVPIAGNLGHVAASGASVSENGVLVYIAGGRSSIQLAWHNREGARQAAIGEPGVYDNLALSPDEKRLALLCYNPAKDYSEVWTLETATGILSRQTSRPSDAPLWSPDSRRLVFSSEETGKFAVYQKAIGETERTLVFEGDKDAFSNQWLPDDSVLITAPSVYRVPLKGVVKPTKLLESAFYIDSRVSPNGRSVGYTNQNLGRAEVYVAAFPSFANKRQVSSGGCQQLWRKDGKELFYLSLDGAMMSVAVKSDGSPQTSAPRVLFQVPFRVETGNLQYAVSGDGKRFLFGDPVGQENRAVAVVLNWTAGLKK